MEKSTAAKTLCSLLVAAVTILACVLPMDDLPIWNGEVPGHRNQYELITESILDGRIDIPYDDDQELAKLENPYDPEARKQAGVEYHWDHAYYEGHYYMYFGIVPVFLVFLPYRLLTGQVLLTCHATQIFAALAIVGIFALFALLCRLFFQKLPFSIYLALSVAFSVMSIWNGVAESALYTTAIIAAVSLEIWSIFFFIKAVWQEQRENRQICLAGVGALLGALAFGCRPPVALANLLVLPMLAVFLKQRRFSAKLLGKLVLAALPYVVIGAALMLYNYARFDNPFEFGQSYQLTVADQSQYGIVLDAENVKRIIKGIVSNFVGIKAPTAEFPFFHTSSVFVNFPILLLCFGVLKPAVRRELKSHDMFWVVAGLLATAIIITVADVVWTPYLLERYRMDIYFLMGIACFMVIGAWYHSTAGRKRRWLGTAVTVLSVVTIIGAFLWYVDTLDILYPEVVQHIGQALHLGGTQ